MSNICLNCVIQNKRAGHPLCRKYPALVVSTDIVAGLRLSYPEHLGSTCWTCPLSSGLTILHGYSLRAFHLFLRFTFDTICLYHIYLLIFDCCMNNIMFSCAMSILWIHYTIWLFVTSCRESSGCFVCLSRVYSFVALSIAAVMRTGCGATISDILAAYYCRFTLSVASLYSIWV